MQGLLEHIFTDQSHVPEKYKLKFFTIIKLLYNFGPENFNPSKLPFSAGSSFVKEQGPPLKLFFYKHRPLGRGS